MTLSVIIPCRDAEATLAETLHSLSLQRRQPDEVLVVDDASSDGSAALARGFGGPVRVLAGDGRGGSAARALGAEAAAGDKLMFLDADDLIGPDTLAALDTALDAHPGQVATCPWRRWERDTTGLWLARPASSPRRRPGDDDLAAWLRGWYHPPCAVLWSRAALQRSGGWDPNVHVNQDGDVMMRGLVAGNRLVFTRAGTAFYRRRPAGEESVSAGRCGAEGLAARLDVLDRIARMLAERGRLRAYAPALADAFRAVGGDCPPALPELARRARAAAAALPRRARRPRPAPLRHDAAITAGPPAGFGPAPARHDPAVSVVLPVHNRPAALERAMESLLSQDFADLELLVVDDASTDATPDIAAGCADPRVRLLRQAENGGVARARNRGIAEARGRHIAFLDSDDAWLPGKLARQVAALEAMPRSVALVHGGVEVVSAGGRRLWHPPMRGYIFEEMLAANRLFAAPSTMLVRREVFDRVGGFDPSLPAIEDYDFLLRVCRFYAVETLADPLTRYDDREETDGAARRSRRLADNISARDALARRYRADMSRAGVAQSFELDTALRALRGGRRDLALRALARAIRIDPRGAQLYGWGALMLLPDGARRRLLSGLRRLAPVPVRRED